MKLTARNDRDWIPGHATLSYGDIHGDTIVLHNIRDFNYRSRNDFDVHYYDSEFKLSELKKVYFIHVPFAPKYGAAHTFLSFEFANNRFVAISMEARRMKGEEFNPLLGLFHHYELMYVAADEHDAIFLRTNHHKHPVYVYPLKDETHHGGKLFLHIIERMNALKAKPEFYNTLTNNCTNGITSHMNELSPQRIPFNYGIVFTSFADKHLFNLGLFDTTETDFRKFQAAHNINALAEQYGDSPDFSLKIRGR